MITPMTNVAAGVTSLDGKPDQGIETIMIICGLKLTHDGAVAMLRDNELVFSVEMEKMDNNPRFSDVPDFKVVPELLSDFGYTVSDVDQWVIDGWDGHTTGNVSLSNYGRPVDLMLAPYRENESIRDLLQPGHMGYFPIGKDEKAYISYFHVTGHLASTYCTSPFAGVGEPSFVLIWDGGMFPRLYYVDPDRGIENGGELFPVPGSIYARAGHHFGPFRRGEVSYQDHNLSVAGKLMAYIALGKARPEIIEILNDAFYKHFEAPTSIVAEYRQKVRGQGSSSEPSLQYIKVLYRELRAQLTARGFSDEDVLASVHEVLQRLLLERIAAKVLNWKGEGPWNLCLAGGCALNIKWNSALRTCNLFQKVWVPPFPNDSGSAIGAAAAHLGSLSGIKAIKWHVRLGPALKPLTSVPNGWASVACPPKELARFLHETAQPVVVLNGRAELGPRALGGRSIVAPATNPAVKDQLNRIKDRGAYRPVAPICLTEFAADIFDPGTPDPYMLFDHKVRKAWVGRIPAILHLDGTARLQTVSREDDPTMELVLREYHRMSGIPVLCNTSANYRGCGFFPDVISAMRWGRLDTVWSEGILYYRTSAAASSGKLYSART